MENPSIRLSECCATCDHGSGPSDRKVCCYFFYDKNDETNSSYFFPPMYAVCNNYKLRTHKRAMGMMWGELGRSLERLAKWLKINISDLSLRFYKTKEPY